FAISGVMEQDKAIAKIKAAIEKTYRKKGERVVADNIKAVEAATGHLHEVKIPAQITATHARSNIVPAFAPEFVKKITSVILEGKGDLLPVSAFSPDGVWPSGTAQFEKRNIAADIPVWDPEMCIQCNKCVEVCPHSAIRVKVSDEKTLENAPSSFKHTNYRGREFENATFTIQVSPEDCTGCTLCSEVCPGRDRNNPDRKALAMRPARDLHEQEKENYDFFRKLPDVDRTKVGATPKQVQLFQPLFEFSGACSACGETPYIKLMTQLFGDRTIIANATGCSSIYGGNLPTTPYTKNADGRGPAWANSLFEDNAEFGFGMRLAVSFKQQQVREMVKNMADKIGPELAAALLEAEQVNEADYKAQRERVDVLKAKMRQIGGAEAVLLEQFADYLVRKSVWIVGGDGWAYDIGFGGLDHVIGQGQNVNILVLDTEAYSNTGGQQSKATPMGASAKFASAGRSMPKKDLGMIAMSYENVYVASVALGAKDTQTVKAFMEAESYDGPSIIIAYSHCSAHGYDISHGMEHQKLAVASGHWPLYRYDPRRAALGKPPLQLDSAEPVIPLSEYMATETRFETVRRSNPERYQMLLAASEQNVKLRYRFYKYLSGFGKTE
ncbi:MAG: 4Fe-4S dicluster domain-containing protein, partial [Pseudomonadota bacterium]|nr:4Fe-4S dicluster domain-containing protein [Pseudomonadota bacterium]